MRIALLGPLEVADGSGRPVEVGGSRLRTLLTLLALDAGRVVTAERLIDGVWGEEPPSGAANALQSLVSRLRRALPGAPIDSQPSGYRLVLDDDAIDVRRFERLVARGRSLLPSDAAGAAEVLAEALELWRGPALADVAGAPFARGHESRLAEQRLGAIEDRVEALLLLGRAEAAELESLVETHPLRERLRGQYMRALCAAGRQADALATFEDARRTLAEELGVDPSAELREVHLAVLRGGPEDQERGRTNLRARLTSFIGREEEIERVGKLLEENRLVTLTGPGGAGKTRLAIEAAEPLAGRMPGGVWLTELAPVGDPAELPQTLLTVLGIRETALVSGVRGTSPAVAEPIERLVAALSGERLLIVLDNCEHLIDAAASLADRVLADCPGVRILATSREALGIIGETLCPVPPLAFPGNSGDARWSGPAGRSRLAAAESPEDGHDLAAAEVVLRYPAVRLLADRGAAVRPDFSVGDDLDAVLAVCRRLDGMPLAIELAAARLRTMTAGQIAERLDDRFRLLTGGSRTALPRHQTLRAVVDWSWDLLDDAERVLLRRLSVFSGGATLDSIEEVCAGDVLDALTGLVEKSLVATDGTGRYRLLETIRAYGLERLSATGELRRVRRAHARHFLELAETAEPLLRTREQLSWLGRLTDEYDNLHSALRWAIEVRDGALAVRYVAALGWYWFLRGQRAEAEQFAREAIAIPGGGGAPLARAVIEIYLLVGSLGEHPWDLEAVRRRLTSAVEACAGVPVEERHPLLRFAPLGFHLLDKRTEEALAELAGLCDTTRDPWLRAAARTIRGHALINLGRVEGLEETFGRTIEEFRALGEQWGLSAALNGLAEIQMWRGAADAAKAHIEEALACSLRFGHHDDSSHLRARLAQAYTVLGDEARAREELRLALRGAERRGVPEDLAIVNFVYGEIARREGDLVTARARLEQAAAHGSGAPQFAAMINVQLGNLHAQDGDLTAARERHVEGFRLARLAHDAPVTGQVLVGFADLSQRAEEPERAATLLGAAVGIRGAEDRSLQDPPRIERAVRAAIGDERFTAAYASGRRMRLPEVNAYLGI